MRRRFKHPNRRAVPATAKRFPSGESRRRADPLLGRGSACCRTGRRAPGREREFGGRALVGLVCRETAAPRCRAAPLVGRGPGRKMPPRRPPPRLRSPAPAVAAEATPTASTRAPHRRPSFARGFAVHQAAEPGRGAPPTADATSTGANPAHAPDANASNFPPRKPRRKRFSVFNETPEPTGGFVPGQPVEPAQHDRCADLLRQARRVPRRATRAHVLPRDFGKGIGRTGRFECRCRWRAGPAVVG